MHAEIRKQVGELKGAAETAAGALRHRQPGDVSALEQHAATARFELARDQVEISGLARAIRADNGGQRAGMKRATHCVDGEMAAETDAQVPRFKGGSSMP